MSLENKLKIVKMSKGSFFFSICCQHNHENVYTKISSLSENHIMLNTVVKAWVGGAATGTGACSIEGHGLLAVPLRQPTTCLHTGNYSFKLCLMVLASPPEFEVMHFLLSTANSFLFNICPEWCPFDLTNDTDPEGSKKSMVGSTI
jgi:hypothetical protein